MENPTREVTIERETNGTGTTGNAPVTRQNDNERGIAPAGPMNRVRRMAEEMDRMFDDWQFGRGWLTPIFGRDSIAKRLDEFGNAMYLPDIEAFEKDGEFIVRADLPGIRKEDVSVDLSDNGLVIRGERKQNEKEVRKGYYRSERSYGSFYRNIPLPAGIDRDNVKATMQDGVLEIAMPLGEENRKRVEIS